MPMTIVACLLLLISFSIAGRATLTTSSSTSSLATGWQDEHVGDEATGRIWLYKDRKKTSSALHGTAELGEKLVKRTSDSSSHRRSSGHPQRTGLQQKRPTRISPGAPPAPHSLAGDTATWSSLNRPAAPEMPSEERSTTHTALNKPYDRLIRRPYGSIKGDPAAQAKAQRQSYARSMKRLKAGDRIHKPRVGRSRYAVRTVEELRIRSRESSRRSRSKRTEGYTVEYKQDQKERQRRIREKRKAQLEAQQEGRIWQGSPVRKPGRPRKHWDQEPEQAGGQDARQHEHSHLGMEEATQHTGDDRHAPPAAHGSNTLNLGTLETSPGSSSMPESSFPQASHHLFAPGPSSPSFELGLSLTAPGLYTSEHGQTRASRQALPGPAGTREEERLRPTLASLDEHDRLRLTLAPPGEHDRLRLTLAPPRHD